MLDTEILPLVAKKIKELRADRQLTLAELSKQSHISKGLLSRIENSRTIPSMPVFVGVVNALGVSMTEFFQGIVATGNKDYILIKKQHREPLVKEAREGFSYELIFTKNIPNSQMQVAVLTVMPGARSTPTTFDGYELKYIVSGCCDYYLGDEMIHLETGDCFFFDARKAHMPVNRSQQPVTMLVAYLLETNL